MISQVNLVFFLTASDVLMTRLRMRHLHIQFQLSDHSRPQSPSFLGHVVGYKLSRVALGTRMLSDLRKQKWKAWIQLMNLIKFARFTYSGCLDRTVKNLDPRSSMHLFSFTVNNERFG